MFLLLHTFSLIIIVLIFSFLGLLVYFRNKKNITNVSFGFFVLVTTFWLITNYFADTPAFYPNALLWNKLAFGGGLAMGAIGIPLFLTNFPSQGKLHLFWKLNFVINSIFITLMIFTPLVVSRVDFYSWGTNIVPGPLFIPLVVWGSVSVVGIFVTFFNKYRNAANWEKIRLKYFVLGFVAFLATSVLLGLILPAVTGVNNLAKFSPYALVLLISGTSYSILKHRLLDIRLVVARAVAYVLLTSILFASYVFITILGTSLFFDTTTQIEQILLYASLTLVIAYTFQPLRRVLENFTDNIFYKGKYDSPELISRLTKVMATTLRLEDLTKGLLTNLVPEMKLSKGAFVLVRSGKVDTFDTFGFTKKPKFVSTDIISLLETDKILIRDEVNQGKLKKIMEELDVASSVPLKVGDEEFGIIILGHKLSGEIYTNQDIKILEILSPEISIAIQNAKAYDELSKFSAKLQQEVLKATTDLRAANERLKELDKAKDEFVSVVSHELRTPMTAIKSYVWLTLNGKAGPINGRMRNYLFKVYQSSERLIGLINDVLDVSHIETGRINLDIQAVSPVKVSEEVVTTLQARAAEQEIKLELEKSETIPMVSADPMKLNEILVNLIGNALKFTPKGGTITVSFSKQENLVEVSVTDTGIGIPKEDLSKLFTKFGRIAKSYSTIAQSTGSGLGLYITKNYLNLMDGKIWVNSELGKGTTLTFTLPIAKNQKIRETVEASGSEITPRHLNWKKSKS